MNPEGRPACAACGRPDLEVVLSLGKMALANALLTQAQLSEPEATYPLDLAVCASCALAQITELVDPQVLFADYAYYSSVSDTIVDQAEGLVERLVSERGLDGDAMVVEVASNDGYLLQHYVAAGVPVLGVDPAAGVAEAAEARGVQTRQAFFGRELGAQLRADGVRADVVHANNVLAHVADLDGVVAGIADILAPSGVLVIETPYVADLIDRLEFDTIYHEHRFYYSLSSLVEVLRRGGLAVVDVERIPIHGGSLRVFAALAADGAVGSARPSTAVSDLIAWEGSAGLAGPDAFTGFADRVEGAQRALVAFVEARRRDGRRIAAYGAAAKGAVLLQSTGLGPETLEFVVDRSPHKQGRFMPGVHLPIVAPERLAGDDAPDDLLLLAWNLADEIVQQQAAFRDRGGRFIVPLPEPAVIG